MEHIIFLYVFFTGCVYASWLFDTKDHFIVKFMCVCCGFVNGWIVTPILIGRVIKQIYKD
jgi:hypothetical protein